MESSTIPFARWDAKGTVVEKEMPDDFQFPVLDWDIDESLVAGIFHHSVRCLRSKNTLSGEIKDWMESKLPKRSSVDVQGEAMAVRRLPKKQRPNPQPSRV